VQGGKQRENESKESKRKGEGAFARAEAFDNAKGEGSSRELMEKEGVSLKVLRGDTRSWEQERYPAGRGKWWKGAADCGEKGLPSKVTFRADSRLGMEGRGLFEKDFGGNSLHWKGG